MKTSESEPEMFAFFSLIRHILSIIVYDTLRENLENMALKKRPSMHAPLRRHPFFILTILLVEQLRQWNRERALLEAPF